MKPYGLTNYAVLPIPSVPSLWSGFSRPGSKGERRAIATIASETADTVVVRSTRPTVISGFVLWTFRKDYRGWKEEQHPGISGGEVDDMEKRDTLTAAIRLMNQTGRKVR